MFPTRAVSWRFRYWRQSQSTLKSPKAQAKAWASHELFPKAQYGLFHGVRIGNGHSVTRKSKVHNKRRFKPNISKRRLFSVILAKPILTTVSTRAIRAIRRAGSLDKYIRSSADDKLGKFGRKIRDDMADHATLQMQFERLGLLPSLEEIRTDFMKDRRGPLNKLHKQKSWTPPDQAAADALKASPLQRALKDLRDREDHSFWGPIKSADATPQK